ncbi:MAG: hypothetical protein Q9218_005204 [Villophora microphyllina]
MSAPKGKKRTSKAAEEDYESDGGFVANDSDSAPKSKKAKTAAPKKAPVKSAKGQTSEEEGFWEITPTRRINISEFNGQRMVNIREYYEDKNSGAMLPGKKGITLPIAQYSTFLTLLPEIEAALIAKGETVARPEFMSRKVGSKDNGDEEEPDDGAETKKSRKPESTKRNFEATSDESEGPSKDD